MVKFATLQRSDHLPLIVALRFQRREGQPISLILLDDHVAVRCTLEAYVGLENQHRFEPRLAGGARTSSTTREIQENILNLIIEAGKQSTIKEFCLVLDRYCWIRATAARAGPG